MFAAVIQKTTPAWQNFNLSWFDLCLAGLLAFGIWRGRRRGLTKELLPFVQWITILLATTFGHPPLASIYEKQGLIQKVFGQSYNVHTAGLLSAYLSILVVIYVFFLAIRRPINRKIEGSNIFGSFEYYGGTIAGLLRYMAIVLISLALLNAPAYSEKEIAADKAYKNKTYGGGLAGYSGDFIPTLYEIQDNIFKHSYSGGFIKEYASILLINSVPPRNSGH
jgi:uncharacterized membrane protein required for colicin V production